MVHLPEIPSGELEAVWCVPVFSQSPLTFPCVVCAILLWPIRDNQNGGDDKKRVFETLLFIGLAALKARGLIPPNTLWCTQAGRKLGGKSKEMDDLFV